MKILLKKNGVLKEVETGFSWTTLFFGFFVPLFRNDIKWFFVMICVSLLTCGLITTVTFPFFYNRVYLKSLLEEGWKSADESTKKFLIGNKFIIEQ